jgi:P27 family predicted phage terminase small subunit
MKVLTLADGLALELCAEAFAEWREADAVVRQHGAFYQTTTKSGEAILPHPAARQRSDAWRRAQRMLSEFGLSPSSRTRVEAIPGGLEPVNAFEQLDRPQLVRQSSRGRGRPA